MKKYIKADEISDKEKIKELEERIAELERINKRQAAKIKDLESQSTWYNHDWYCER